MTNKLQNALGNFEAVCAAGIIDTPEWQAVIEAAGEDARIAQAVRDKATLRDQFAMAALPNLMKDYADFEEKHFPSTADKCYRMADAMLVERSKSK